MTLLGDEIVSPQSSRELPIPLAIPAPSMEERLRRKAVSTRFVDFWLLGGASIVLWAVMQLGELFRARSNVIENHFTQVGAVFAMMSIFCNYPHFMISYRFGYGRGFGFVKRHWFALLAVPLGLIAAYALAYFHYDHELSDRPWVTHLNFLFEKIGLGFRLGTLDNLGTEILSLSVLLMNMTVGWHYSKQVFGCIMVYARYDRYPISRLQRALVKASLFSVAFLNFFSLSIDAENYSSSAPGKSYFYNIPLMPLGLPPKLVPATAVITAILASATVVFVFYSNYRRYKLLPTLNLVIPWIAFFFWWVPLRRQTEYYLATVPFFHSLQYLPFAYRVEETRFKASRRPELRKSIFLAILLFVGFCSFELVPNLLDQVLQTGWYLKSWFFMASFAVFINIHHFFIDSVVWKFSRKDQKELRLALLE
ncbi:MAG: hypothetical protein P4M08_05310 [Oligoflexia bacterium]|nr:hypothetical protein [Oligoflexia bacterium]